MLLLGTRMPWWLELFIHSDLFVSMHAFVRSFKDFSFFTDILHVSELPEGQAVVESVMSYDWHIDTKYYTADIQLCTTNARTIGDKTFAESVQAFVIYFDSQEVSVLPLGFTSCVLSLVSVWSLLYYTCVCVLLLLLVLVLVLSACQSVQCTLCTILH